MVDWLVGLPTVVLFLGLIAIGLLVAFGLSWLSSRVIEDEVRARTSTSVTTMVGVVAPSASASNRRRLVPSGTNRGISLIG
jgi:peptidoglycan/LPS O-acetylase OafA/YrhL